MLESILGSGESSLFVHFERQVINEMNEANSIKLFNKYLKARKITENDNIAKTAYQLVGGQPFYLMAIAEGWIKGEKVAETLNRLLTDPLGTLRLYTEYVLSEDLKAATGGPILRTILSALSDSDNGHSFSELAKKTGIPMHTISRYIPSLLTADLITQVEGTIKIRDRVILEYLKLQT